MAATVTQFGTTVASVSGSWTGLSVANLNSDNNVYATITPGNGADGSFRLSNFGVNLAIPAGAVITSVKVEYQIKYSGSAATYTATISPEVSGVATSNNTDTTTPTVDTTRNIDVTADRAWTRANLLDGTFTILLKVARSAATSLTASIDYVSLIVSYTPNFTRVSQEAIENLDAGTPRVRVSQEAIENLSGGNAASTRVSQEAIENLSGGNAASERVSQVVVESLIQHNPTRAGVSQEAIENLTKGAPKTRVSQEAIENLTQGHPKALVSQEVVESLSVGNPPHERTSQLIVESLIARSLAHIGVSQLVVESLIEVPHGRMRVRAKFMGA